MWIGPVLVDNDFCGAEGIGWRTIAGRGAGAGTKAGAAGAGVTMNADGSLSAAAGIGVAAGLGGVKEQAGVGTGVASGSGVGSTAAASLLRTSRRFRPWPARRGAGDRRHLHRTHGDGLGGGVSGRRGRSTTGAGTAPVRREICGKEVVWRGGGGAGIGPVWRGTGGTGAVDEPDGGGGCGRYRRASMTRHGTGVGSGLLLRDGIGTGAGSGTEAKGGGGAAGIAPVANGGGGAAGICAVASGGAGAAAIGLIGAEIESCWCSGIGVGVLAGRVAAGGFAVCEGGVASVVAAVRE